MGAVEAKRGRCLVGLLELREGEKGGGRGKGLAGSARWPGMSAGKRIRGSCGRRIEWEAGSKMQEEKEEAS